MTRAVPRVLGLDVAEAEPLVRLARERLGARGYALRVAALLVAASRPARLLLPRELRLRAIRPLVFSLLWGPAENLTYVRRLPRQ